MKSFIVCDVPSKLFFFSRLTKGSKLTHREILDIIEFRMGGDFLQELRELRSSGATLSEIVEYFLKKDAEMRSYARRRARLEAQAKVYPTNWDIINVFV